MKTPRLESLPGAAFPLISCFLLLTHHLFRVDLSVRDDLQQVQAFAKDIQVDACAVRQMIGQQQAAGQAVQAYIGGAGLLQIEFDQARGGRIGQGLEKIGSDRLLRVAYADGHFLAVGLGRAPVLRHQHHSVDARLSIFVNRIFLGAGGAVAKIPMVAGGPERGVLESHAGRAGKALPGG